MRRPPVNPRTRLVYAGLGLSALSLGALGAFLPILPTVPFLVLAAWCFQRSNPALERRLLEHPRLGAPLRLWRRHGAFPPHAKLLALAALAVSAALAGTQGLVVRAVAWPVLLVVAAWIGSRPNGPRPSTTAAEPLARALPPPRAPDGSATLALQRALADPTRAVVGVNGQLDHATTPQFEARTVDAFGRASVVVLDLSRLTAISAVGHGSLLALAGRSHQRGRQVLVIRPPRASWFLPVDEALTGLGVPVANAGR